MTGFFYDRILPAFSDGQIPTDAAQAGTNLAPGRDISYVCCIAFDVILATGPELF